MTTHKKILIVGLCCVDVVNYVTKFPTEDSDTRVMEMKTVLGGNAANNIQVLQQLDPKAGCLFASMPKDDNVLSNLVHDLGIRLIAAGPFVCRSPISTIIVNTTEGTRTILHYRGDLPESTLEEFKDKFPDLEEFSWIHFEGRNFEELPKIINYCKKLIEPNKCNISVELEKIRNFNWWQPIVPLVEVVFMSKDFAKSNNWTDPHLALNKIIDMFPDHNLAVILPWGEKGAFSRESTSPNIYQAHTSIASEEVVDTLGAGDCFIGAALYFLNRRCLTEVVLKKATEAASRKCTKYGLLNLGIQDLKLD